MISDSEEAAPGVLSQSGNGRGLKMVIRERVYVIPVRRMKRLLNERRRKKQCLR
ncbi:MAG: hypothetical protein V1862_07120 [Methanobacteriota archaeon]